MTPEVPENPRPPRDRVIAILVWFTALYTLALAAAIIWLPGNERLSTLLGAQLSAFSGALLLRLKS